MIVMTISTRELGRTLAAVFPFRWLREQGVYDRRVECLSHLQRIDEKMEWFNIDNTTPSDSTVSLSDEREVTRQCLRICEDARHYIKSLASWEFSLLQDQPQDNAKDSGQNCFEAQLLTCQALNENCNSFPVIIGQLQNCLESLVLKNDSSDEKERSCLQEDINTSKQCLEVCKGASEVSCRKIYRIGEVIADGDSDQVACSFRLCPHGSGIIWLPFHVDLLVSRAQVLVFWTLHSCTQWGHLGRMVSTTSLA